MKLSYDVNEENKIVYTEMKQVKDIRIAHNLIFKMRCQNVELGYVRFFHFIIYDDKRKIVAHYKL